MRINRIVLKDFRNFGHVKIGPFAEGPNFFYGPNGRALRVLVIDGTFAELDQMTRKSLLGLLSGGGQVFLASAIMSGSESEKMTVFEVHEGLVRRRER